MQRPSAADVARALAAQYERPFGGKPGGRYRISRKTLRATAVRRRLPDDFLRQLAEEMFELGYVFLDLETFFAVASARSFANYRRLSEAAMGTDHAPGEHAPH